MIEHRRKSMGTERFTPEFKQEAVRQVIERGYTVADVAARVGVSAHSLYKWVKSIKPDKSDQHAAELVEASANRFRRQIEQLAARSSKPTAAG
jgi:transposase